MTRTNSVVASVLAFCVLQTPTSAPAFVPGGGSAIATAGKSHKELTLEALDEVYLTYGYGPLVPRDYTEPMKEAREAIADKNADIDDKEPTQTRSHCDAEQLQLCSDRIKERLQEAVDLLRNSDDVVPARTKVGNALHTLQDFYSHSNWIELDNKSPSSELGRLLGSNSLSNLAAPGEATCDAAPIFNLCFEENVVTPRLTSGYFVDYLGRSDKPPTVGGKCRHGGTFDFSSGPNGGINKDSSTCFIGTGTVVISPHEDQNDEAAKVAIAATVQAFADVKAKLADDQKFKALLGIGGKSLAFAVDTTGSMGSVIAGVRSTAVSIINSRLSTADEPFQYVIVPFNDPSTGPVTNTGDPDIAKSAINSLFATGGGDCPELAMRGSQLALSALQEGGTLFGFTDASAKDASLATEVTNLAVAKKIRVSWALFGSCSPYDPAYFRLANETGGQVFVLGRSEAGAVTQLADFLTRGDAVDILSIAGTLGTTTTTHTFPVDTQTSRITVSVAIAESATIVVYRPDGSQVLAGQAGVTQVPITAGRIFSISAPQIGNWRITIQGTGEYSALVNGNSSLSLDKLLFARLGGRPGHEGYFPIDGFPVSGRSYPVIGKLSGVAQNIEFQLRSRSDQLLQSFLLSSTNADTGELIGNLVAPSQSFVVYAVGADSNGAAFQRVLATQTTPQPIAIVPPTAVDLGKGQATNYIFQVTNTGSADTFSFTGLDDKGFVTSVSPTSATLGLGSAVNVRVTLVPPTSIATGTSDTLTFTAKSTTRAEVRNFAVLASTVVDAVPVGDVNRDGVVNCDDLGLVKASFGTRAGQPSFNPNVDLDSNGIVDVRDLAAVARRVPAGTVCN